MWSALTLWLRALVALPFFARAQALSPWEAIGWWERRRIPFNLAVGVTGLFTCAVGLLSLAIIGRAMDEPFETLEMPDPFLGIFAVGAYAVMANLCFTGGWIVELVVRWLWREDGTRFASIGFTLGLVFYMALTLVPGVSMVLLAGLELLLSATGAGR